MRAVVAHSAKCIRSSLWMHILILRLCHLSQQLSKLIDWRPTQMAHTACTLVSEQFSVCIAHV